MSAVRQIPVPGEARALSTLEQIEYSDAFLVDADPSGELPPEHLARVFLEQAPLALRSSLLSGWSALGLKLKPAQPSGYVLGWEVRRSTSDHVLLGAESRVGMPAELLLKRHDDRLLFCTFVQLGNLVVRGVWAGVKPGHVPVVRRVLAQGAERAQAPLLS
jgi:hypothetical protein